MTEEERKIFNDFFYILDERTCKIKEGIKLKKFLIEKIKTIPQVQYKIEIDFEISEGPEGYYNLGFTDYNNLFFGDFNNFNDLYIIFSRIDYNNYFYDIQNISSLRNEYFRKEKIFKNIFICDDILLSTLESIDMTKIYTENDKSGLVKFKHQNDFCFRSKEFIIDSFLRNKKLDVLKLNI